MGKRLILVRHGQTDYNAAGRMQGHINSTLTAAGQRQALGAAELLAGVDARRIISSDLDRALFTAQALAEKLGLAVETDERLRETHLGEWQGRTRGEVEDSHPGHQEVWRGDATFTPPGGESRLDVGQRTRPVVDELVAAHPDWDAEGYAIVLVAHGGAISALTGHLLGFAAKDYPLLLNLDNAHWSTLETRDYDPDRWLLREWNAGEVSPSL